MRYDSAEKQLSRGIRLLSLSVENPEQTCFLRAIKNKYNYSRRELATATKVSHSVVADILAGKHRYMLDIYEIARLVCFVQRMMPTTGFIRRDGGRLIPHDMKNWNGTYGAPYRLLTGFRAPRK
jgi:hypothetical protein